MAHEEVPYHFDAIFCCDILWYRPEIYGTWHDTSNQWVPDIAVDELEDVPLLPSRPTRPAMHLFSAERALVIPQRQLGSFDLWITMERSGEVWKSLKILLEVWGVYDASQTIEPSRCLLLLSFWSCSFWQIATSPWTGQSLASLGQFHIHWYWGHSQSLLIVSGYPLGYFSMCSMHDMFSPKGDGGRRPVTRGLDASLGCHHGGFLKYVITPKIIQFDRIFSCKPAILGYHHLWKPPYVRNLQWEMHIIGRMIHPHVTPQGGNRTSTTVPKTTPSYSCPRYLWQDMIGLLFLLFVYSSPLPLDDVPFLGAFIPSEWMD